MSQSKDKTPPAGDGDRVQTSAIVTVPNVLTLLRLALIPVFVWLALGPEADGWAFLVLAVSSVTDWLDGIIARRYQMVSRVGQLLDPIADRLFVLTTILVLAIRDIVPWWLVAALVVRDLVMVLVQLAMRKNDLPPLPVNYVGKAATVCLLFGLTMLILTDSTSTLADIVRPIAWAFTVWGLGIYWWSAALYAAETRAILRRHRVAASA